MCQSTSNKDYDQDAPTYNNSSLGTTSTVSTSLSAAAAANVGLESIESITSAISSRAANLRDMMRRAAAASRLDGSVTLSGTANTATGAPPSMGQSSSLNPQVNIG